MRFATFNSKPPSATLGVVAGHLDGTDRILVVFNCLTRLAVFEQSSASGELVFLDDIPLHCSLKYMKVVPITDTDTHRTVRHVLFLFSVKQELLLTTIERVPSASTCAEPPHRAADASGTRSGGTTLRLVTLYQSGIDGCLHQFNPGEISLVCATGELCPTPLVAFSVNRGDIYFLDVFAAMASHAMPAESRRKRTATLDLLHAQFPPCVVSAVDARKSVLPLSRTSFDFTEFDVKDITFGAAATPADGVSRKAAVSTADGPVTGLERLPAESNHVGTQAGVASAGNVGSVATPARSALPLFVLFADRHGRCHVSQYSYSTSVSVATQPSAACVFPFSRDVLCDSGARAVRQGTVQTNVDPSAAFLSVTAGGLFVVGNHLVTYLSLRTPRRRAVTCELPPSQTGSAVVSCVCRTSGGAAGSLGTATPGASVGAHSGMPYREESLVVCFSDGVCGRISVDVPDLMASTSSVSVSGGVSALGATVGAGASSSSEGVLMDGGVHHPPHLTIQFFRHVLPTVPTDIAAVSPRCWVVASQFSDSLFVDLQTGTTTVVLKNCGPILGMEVVRDGPRASVVASTGVNGGGGVSLVRSAVTFEEETIVDLPDDVVATHTSCHLIALTMRDSGPRFFCAVDGTAASIRHVTHRMPTALTARHNTAIVDMHGTPQPCGSILYTIATRSGLFMVEETRHDTSTSHGQPNAAHSRGAEITMTMKATTPFGREAMFASICGMYCAVVGDDANIYVYKNVTESSRVVPIPTACHHLSAFHLATETTVLYGDWSLEQVHVLELNHDASRDQSPVVSHRAVTVSSVPRSLCMIGRRIFAGLLKGVVVEVSADGAKVVQQAVVSHLPVELSVLPGHTDTLLCRGPVPLLLLLNESLQVTGLSTPSATSCSTMTLTPSAGLRRVSDTRQSADLAVSGRGRAARGGDGRGHGAGNSRPHTRHDATSSSTRDSDAADDQAQTLAIWSREERELILGRVENTQKLNHTFLGMHGTVTHLADVPQWDSFAVSVRRPEKDEVLLVPHSFVTHSGTVASPLLAASAEDSLLENERCVFFEPLYLSTNESAGLSLSPPPGARADDPAVSLLVGSTFVFPDEQRARSSRIAWFCRSVPSRAVTSGAPVHTHQGTTVGGAALQLMGEKDISGALQCCCVVPNYPGRIALGVSGCIMTFHWSPVDATFVAEERCHVGLSLTKLIPLPYPVAPSTTATSTAVDGRSSSAPPLPSASIVALDARHSATYLYVDPVQGSVKVVGRDGKARGIVDGAWTGSGSGLCVADDSLNLLHVEFCAVERASGARAGDTDGNENQQGGAAASAPPLRARVVTTAQAHIGDLITCLCPGSFAPSITSDSALAPPSLVKGIAGLQMVYGTAHGAFGTITPLRDATHCFLRAIEAALHRVTAGSGGFQHSGFRELLTTGQERGVSRNASFDIPLLQSITQERRREEAARSCVDGDYVESFLLLTPDVQRRVLHLAEVYLIGWTRQHVTQERASSLSQNDAISVDSDNFPPGVPYPEASVAHTPAQVDEQCRETCNRFLREDALPLLPLDVTAVRTFLYALQWIH